MIRIMSHAWKDRRGLDRPALPGDLNHSLETTAIMKTRTSRKCWPVSLGVAFLITVGAIAQTTIPADSTPVSLPYGVEDVLKLSRAQVSEDVTLNYIRNSGTIYNLAPNDIVYLRNQGVSDRVINTMIDQRKNVPAEAAAQSAMPQAPVDANAVVAAQSALQYAPTYASPAPVYVQPEPVYPPASSVYVIPSGGGGYSYANAYPYPYGGYYGYGGPSVVFRFGYGSGGRYGGYHGSHYGGYHGGSGHYRSYGHH
jgi:hypothetical protein